MFRPPILMSLGFVALACAPAKVDPPPVAPMNWTSFAIAAPPSAASERATVKERAIAEAYLATLGSPGFAGLGPMLDEYAKFAFDNADGGAGIDARGRERVVNAHETLFGAFEERKLSASRVLLTDDSQALEWVMTGVHARDFMGIPATRKPVAVKGITLVWTKDDGAITEIHVCFDVLALKTQLGAKARADLPPVAIPSGPPQVIERVGSADEVRNTTEFVEASVVEVKPSPGKGVQIWLDKGSDAGLRDGAPGRVFARGDKDLVDESAFALSKVVDRAHAYVETSSPRIGRLLVPGAHVRLNVSAVRTALDALEEGDEAAYLSTMADDVEVQTLEQAQPARGKEKQRAYFRAMRKALGQLDTAVLRQWAIGSLVVVEYTLGGEQRAPVGPIPFTGYRALQMGVVDVVEIRDGRIARIVRYDNPDAATSPK